MPEVESLEKHQDIFPIELTDSCRSLPTPSPTQIKPTNGYHRAMYHHPPRVSRTRSLSINETSKAPAGNSPTVSSAILFRNSSGAPVVQPLAAFSKDGPSSDEDILNFFKCYKCYDLIPTSAKLVVLDTRLIVKRAFYAMVDTGVRACPLWDSVRQQFIGMLTITDFIRILQKYYAGAGKEMQAFEELRLCDVKVLSAEEPSSVLHMYPDSSLFDAASILIRNKIHRLPIIDPSDGNVLYIMTQKPMLKFLYKFFPRLDQVSILHRTILDAGVGTFNKIKVATEETKIIEALNDFVEERISALPIVDSEGKLVNIYSKFDVINLAAEKTYSNLDATLAEANQHKTEWFDGVHSCVATDTVLTVIERLVKTDVARLVVVDEEEKVVGVVTVSGRLLYPSTLKGCTAFLTGG
jgi:5'-AMP-activated protein kinase regulatory gamma subunit